MKKIKPFARRATCALCAVVMALMLIPTAAFSETSKLASGSQDTASTAQSDSASSQTTVATSASTANTAAQAPAATDAQTGTSLSASTGASTSTNTLAATTQPTAAEKPAASASTQSSPAPVITPQAGTPSLNLNVEKADASIIDASGLADWCLGEHYNGYVQLTYVGVANTTGNKVTFHLPDYYSFDNPTSGANYTIETPTSDTSTNANAVDNVMVVDIPDPGNQPPAIGMSFKVKLNTAAISDTDKAAWKAGSWTPNSGNCTFKVTDALSSAAVEKDVTIVTREYPNPKVLPRSEGYGLLEHGLFNDPFGNRSVDTTYALAYASPDLYLYGPMDINSITVAAPSGFVFDGFSPNASESFNIDGQTALNVTSSVTNSNVSATSATFSIADPGTTGYAYRFISLLKLKPDTTHLSNDNADAATLYPSGSTHDVTASFSFDAAGGTVSKTAATTLKTGTYTLGETRAVEGEGTHDSVRNITVLKQVKAGSEGNSTDIVNTASNTRNPGSLGQRETAAQGFSWIAPSSKGEGSVVTTSFDPNIQLAKATVNLALQSPTSNAGEPYSEGKASSLTYYTTAHPEGITVDLSSNSGQTYQVAPSLEDGEYITKISVKYSVFAYQAVSVIKSLDSFAIPSTSVGGDVLGADGTTHYTDQGHAFQPCESLPIKTEIADASGSVLDYSLNFIQILPLKCPALVSTVSTAFDRSHYSTGVYSDNAVEQNAYSIGLGTNFVGSYRDASGNVVADSKGSTTSGYLSELENLKISVSTSIGNFNGYPVQSSTGQFVIHKIMNDGGWTVTYSAQTISGAKAGAAPVVHTVTLPAFSTDTMAIDLHDSSLFGSQSLGSDEYIVSSVAFSHQGMLDISSLSKIYDGSESGSSDGVDRTFLDASIEHRDQFELNGIYYGLTVQSSDVSSSMATWSNCTDIDQYHVEGNPNNNPSARLPLNGSTQDISLRGDLPVNKGADNILVTGSKTTYSGALKQGKTTTISGNEQIGAAYLSADALFYLQPGDAFYLKLTDQQYSTFVPGSATIEGVSDPDAAIVTINGARYLKMTYWGEPVSKAKTSEIGPSVIANHNVSYLEGISFTFDVYSLYLTPVGTDLNLIDSTGSWLDIAAGDVYTYSKDGTQVKTAVQGIDPRISDPWMPQVSISSYPKGTTACYDDPLSIYNVAASSSERNWAIAVDGLSITPEQDAIQGVLLNPGISNSYQQETQPVKSYQEGSLTTSISVMGDSSVDYTNLSSTIKLPREGDTLSSDATKTSDVDLYLTGPVVLAIPTRRYEE